MIRTSKRWNLVLNSANMSMKSNETVVKGVFGSRRNNELPNTLNMVTYIFCYNDVYKRNITILTSGDESCGGYRMCGDMRGICGCDRRSCYCF